MRVGLWVLGLLAVVACGGTSPPPPSAAAPAGASPAPVAPDGGTDASQALAAGAPTTDATPAAGPEVHFEPLEPATSPDPLPHVEIKFPVMEKPIRLPKAPRYRVRLEVDGWPLGMHSAGVQLSLDDHPPRVFDDLSQPIRLQQLVSEDQEIGPGPHRLFAVAVRATGETVKPPRPMSRSPFAAVRFHVGHRAPPEPDAPHLVYSQPRGTYNGDVAADSVLVDFYVVGAELGQETFGVEVSVRGLGGTWSTRLRRWQPLRIRGLPSGDFDVTVQLLGPDDEPVQRAGAHVSRTITINRDAPVAPGAAP